MIVIQICFEALYYECLFVMINTIPGVPEKAERWIFSTIRAESVKYFYIIR